MQEFLYRAGFFNAPASLRFWLYTSLRTILVWKHVVASVLSGHWPLQTQKWQETIYKIRSMIFQDLRSNECPALKGLRLASICTIYSIHIDTYTYTYAICILDSKCEDQTLYFTVKDLKMHELYIHQYHMTSLPETPILSVFFFGVDHPSTHSTGTTLAVRTDGFCWDISWEHDPAPRTMGPWYNVLVQWWFMDGQIW